jgi:hypothetical protein
LEASRTQRATQRGRDTKGTYSFVFCRSVASGNSASNRGAASSALTGNTKEYVPFVSPFVFATREQRVSV